MPWISCAFPSIAPDRGGDNADSPGQHDGDAAEEIDDRDADDRLEENLELQRPGDAEQGFDRCGQSRNDLPRNAKLSVESFPSIATAMRVAADAIQ